MWNKKSIYKSNGWHYIVTNCNRTKNSSSKLQFIKDTDMLTNRNQGSDFVQTC